jgi:hypothetical protein
MVFSARPVESTQNHWVSGSCTSSEIPKLDLFSSSYEVRETPILLAPLERANLNHKDQTEYVSAFPYMDIETDPISEMSCFLVI